MPEWLWSIVVGVVVVGLIVALRNADRDRIVKLEQWVKDKEKFDHDFRHDEYAPSVDAINSRLLPMVEKVDGVTKRVDRIEAKMNGYLRREEER